MDVALGMIDVLGYRRGMIADPMKESAGLAWRLWRLVSNPYRYGELVIITKDRREWSFLVNDLPGWFNAISDAMAALGRLEKKHP
jgi:hypothetical protein